MGVKVESDKTAKSLNALSVKVGDREVIADVGYTAPYALAVHENVEMKWRGRPRKSGRGSYWDPPGRGQAKYLEGPARRYKKVIMSIIKDGLNRGLTLVKAVYLGAQRLFRESQAVVPVHTGYLKSTGYVSVKEGTKRA